MGSRLKVTKPESAGVAAARRKPDTTIAGVGRTPASMAIDPSADAPVPEIAAIEPAADRKVTPVTITGCLEQSDDSFRLKDTTGAAAPKSRSWKSGFLKKGSAPIDVVDASHRLNLKTHVGRRVSVTGTLVDHELQVRSLQRVAASCSATPKVSA